MRSSEMLQMEISTGPVQEASGPEKASLIARFEITIRQFTNKSDKLSFVRSEGVQRG